jgi:Phage P22-like portal protein
MTNDSTESDIDGLNPDNDDDLLQIAKHRFKLCVEAEAKNRSDEIDDLHFMIGDQWPLDIRNLRQQDQRPCLTINRLPQYVRSVTNEIRQNRPSIKINPCDDAADVDTAKVLQGMIRHIENNSHSDIAIDTAVGQAAKSGKGYFRLLTEYSDPMSFQQEIKIKQILNRFSVYLDPYYQEPDGSDAEFGFIVDEMSKEEYRAQFGKSKLSSQPSWNSEGDGQNPFFIDNGVRVCEYLYKVWEEVDIVQLTSGKVLEKSLLEKITLPDGVRVVKERRASVPRIKWAKINGVEVLERTDIPGMWIPIIPVVGEEDFVDGKKVTSGVIRYAKDAQRMFNYMKTAEAEMIGLAPKAPFIVMEGQLEGYEKQWDSANTKNWGYLQYKPKSVAGQPAPPPQRTAWEPPVQAITQSIVQSIDDLKATTGIYDDALGKQSNAESGKAIERRTSQSQVSNFHYLDNLSRSLRHAGRIIVNWIPKIYDTPQTVRIIGDDGEVDFAQINQIFHENGEEKSHFLDHGTYDVTVDTGPSYQTKRQEAVASMLELTKIYPQAMQIIGDLLVSNMDWQQARECAARIKKTIPPNILDDGKEDIPPQAKAQMSQMNQMVQTLGKHLEEAYKIINTKQVETTSKERIATSEQRTQLIVEWMKHHAKDSQLAFEVAVDQANKRFDQLNGNQSIQDGVAGAEQASGAQNLQQPTGGLSPGQASPAPSMGGQP